MLYPIERNNKFGLINRLGEEVVSPRFFGLGTPTKEGTVATVSGDSFGVIDHTGTFRIPAIYKSLGNFFSCGLLSAARASKHGYIDVNGVTVIDFLYLSASHFSEDRASVKTGDRQYSFLDKSGRINGDRKFEQVRFYSDGRAGVVLNGKMGFVDLNGDLVIEPRYDSLATGNFSEGHAFVCELSKTVLKCGLINKSGNAVLPLDFSGVGSVYKGIVKVSHFGGTAYVRVPSLDHSDLFDDATDFCDSHAFVKTEQAWHIIDSEFEVKGRVDYDNVNPFRAGCAIVEKDSKEGLVDFHGAALSSIDFDELQHIDGVLYEFVRGRESGYIDLKENVVWSSRA
ncbi:WG repeat-containing protein [Prosthecobacter sp.]|uniref:WG repeat-containing protein n=1 Tax=Prosthecobacter sp. TaxID=1965333 RepID=UPI0037832B69